jgi:hypothetical protein
MSHPQVWGVWSTVVTVFQCFSYFIHGLNQPSVLVDGHDDERSVNRVDNIPDSLRRTRLIGIKAN